MRMRISLPPGITDDNTSLATSGRWRDGSNVRFWDGLPQTIGGWEIYVPTAITGVCRNIHAWTDNSGQINAAFGSHSKLILEQGGALYDVTPSGLAAGNIDGLAGAGYGTGTYDSGLYGAPTTSPLFPRTWSLSTWGQNLIASPRGGTIYSWDNVTANIATAVTNAPAACTSVIVVPERQIIALGCNESSGGVFNPLCIRWCDLENRTVWAETSTNNAGEAILEGAGRIIAGKTASGGFFVWTDNAVFFARFVGDPGQTWRFDRLGQNCGLIGANAACVIGDTAYWLSSSGQFFTCASGGAPVMMPCEIRSDMFDNISAAQGDKIVASSVSAWGEVWWFYPDQRDGNENSRYIAVSLALGSWFRGDLARTAYIDQGVLPYPLAVDYSGYVYYHEKGTTANGGPFAWALDSSDILLDPNGERVLLMRGIWPDIQRQSGGILLDVKTRLWPQDTELSAGSWQLSTGQSKQDFMASGRMIRLSFSGNSAPAFARFGAPIIDIQQAGKM